MNIRVRGEPNHLKNKCCSSWGTTRGYYNSMNRNYLTWKLSSLILKCFRRMLVPRRKNLETQVGQLALNIPNQSKGTFPSDTQKNPKYCMVIQLRSGKDLSSNKRTERKEETEAEKEETEKEGEKNTQIEHPKGKNDQKKKEGVPAYTPSVPFPQRLHKSRREEQFSKFLDIFKKIETNIPFAEVIIQMPLYAKFLKEILSKKKEDS